MASDLKKGMLDAIDKWMDDAADEIFAGSQDNLVNDAKIDTGFLLKTGNINRVRLKKTIIYPADYADDVEYGRMAGTMPPVAPIKEWTKRKLGITNPKQLNNTAWAIATSIKSRGIQPAPYLRPSGQDFIIKNGGINEQL